MVNSTSRESGDRESSPIDWQSLFADGSFWDLFSESERLGACRDLKGNRFDA